MNLDWVPWVIRAVLITVGIVMAIIVVKRERKGIYQGQYYVGILVIGITAFTIGIITLAVSLITDLLFEYSLFLIVAGVIVFFIGLIARKIWKKTGGL